MSKDDSRINDLDMRRWSAPEYADLFTESWWPIDNFEGRPEHTRGYHGLFVPQIPNQLLRRYTKKYDWVLDPMCGMGTTAIEAAYLQRRSLNTDLNRVVLERAAKAAETAFRKARALLNPFRSNHRFSPGDARTFDYRSLMEKVEHVKLIVLHPPYHDILSFGDDPEDLSRAQSLDRFLIDFGRVVKNVLPTLAPGGHLALVVGDYYRKSEWIPLGFHCMQAVQRPGLVLKAVNVKRTCETRGKAGMRALWRRRCLEHGLTMFAHEFIFIFRKK